MVLYKCPKHSLWILSHCCMCAHLWVKCIKEGCTSMPMNVEVRGQPWVSALRHLLILFETGSHIVLEFTKQSRLSCWQAPGICDSHMWLSSTEMLSTWNLSHVGFWSSTRVLTRWDLTYSPIWPAPASASVIYLHSKCVWDTQPQSMFIPPLKLKGLCLQCCRGILEKSSLLP